MKYLLFISFQLMLFCEALSQTQQGFVEVQDGKLYYERAGTGSPIVFLHGICLDHRMWQDQVNFFSDSFTCISLDLRGFGKSSLPTNSYSFHEDLNTFLDSLKITEPIILIAASMGGKAAINFSLTYPQKVKSLVLADVAVDGYIFKEFKLDPIYDLAKQKGIDSANQMFLNHKIFAFARNDSSVYHLLREMILSYSGWQWTHKNPIQGLTPPALQRLDQIKVPVLIITGENDIKDFQEIADILHSNIKSSVKKQILNTGHMCNMENPKAFNSLVSDFLHLKN
jgi:pimeloyl-ACP methyl ester carboxylesterase